MYRELQRLDYFYLFFGIKTQEVQRSLCSQLTTKGTQKVNHKGLFLHEKEHNTCYPPRSLGVDTLISLVTFALSVWQRLPAPDPLPAPYHIFPQSIYRSYLMNFTMSFNVHMSDLYSAYFVSGGNSCALCCKYRIEFIIIRKVFTKLCCASICLM